MAKLTTSDGAGPRLSRPPAAPRSAPPMLPPAPATDTATGPTTSTGDGTPSSRAQRAVQARSHEQHGPFRARPVRHRSRGPRDPRQPGALARRASQRARSRSKAIADERGTREYNLALGDRRANAAKNYLAARGIYAGADHHDQLWQGAPGRARLGRSQLGAEPPRGDDRHQLSPVPSPREDCRKAARGHHGARPFSFRLATPPKLDINMISQLTGGNDDRIDTSQRHALTAERARGRRGTASGYVMLLRDCCSRSSPSVRRR